MEKALSDQHFLIISQSNNMQKVKVIEVDRYRDGGTVVYQDELNRRYYTWRNLRPKVYNQMPNPGGNSTIPPPYVQEIPVELEIVDKF